MWIATSDLQINVKNMLIGEVSDQLLLQSERFYKSAHAAKKAAMQPFHGLVQLYRRSGAYDQQADALRHILSHSSTDEATVHNTRIELATALLKSNQAEEAWQVLVAIEDGLQSAAGFGEPFEVPHAVALLRADCQMMLDEAEYNSRLAEARKGGCSADCAEDDDLLTQRVAAAWVRPPYHYQHILLIQHYQPRPRTPQSSQTTYRQQHPLHRILCQTSRRTCYPVRDPLLHTTSIHGHRCATPPAHRRTRTCAGMADAREDTKLPKTLSVHLQGTTPQVRGEAPASVHTPCGRTVRVGPCHPRLFAAAPA